MKDKQYYVTHDSGTDDWVVHTSKEDAMMHMKIETEHNEDIEFEVFKQVPLKILRTVKVTVDVSIGKKKKKGGKHG